jgi:hypothetical protein
MARAPFHQAKLEIPLLNDSGDSYTRWCKTMTLVLRYQGLWCRDSLLYKGSEDDDGLGVEVTG